MLVAIGGERKLFNNESEYYDLSGEEIYNETDRQTEREMQSTTVNTKSYFISHAFRIDLFIISSIYFVQVFVYYALTTFF